MEHERQGRLIVCGVVWAELRVLIGEEKLASFLKDNRIAVDRELTPEVWAAAQE